MRILFDNNVPAGLRALLPRHEVRTILEMNWSPRITNGELLSAAEAAAFDVLVTSDQNIRYQQNLADRKLALVILGSNIWKVVRSHAGSIAEAVDRAKPGHVEMVAIPLPKRPPKRSPRK